MLLMLNFMLENQFKTEVVVEDDQYEDHPGSTCYSDMFETYSVIENDDAEKDDEEVEKTQADLGSGWGRIIYFPLRRGKWVEFDVCQSTNDEGIERSFV